MCLITNYNYQIITNYNYQTMFKKSNQGSMQGLLDKLTKNNPFTCRMVESTIQHFEMKYFKLEPSSKEKVINPPDISFRISMPVQVKLKEKL